MNSSIAQASSNPPLNTASSFNPNLNSTLSDRVIVTAAQMRAIEARIFAAGMPVAALMEKVAGLISTRLQALYPVNTHPRIGVLVGPGHNGGDALVVARELHFRDYHVGLWCPWETLKDLTASHLNYCKSLGIFQVEAVEELGDRDLWLDGLFGFGLERPVQGAVAEGITWVNTQGKPILSIDLPSGLHTDTGEILGTAIRASHTLCLGLWKRGLFEDAALAHIGEGERLDFDLPWTDIMAVLGDPPPLQRLTPSVVQAGLPLPIPLASHKYQRGHLLVIAGSRRYRGAAVLTGLGARASGVGLLSIAVPQSLQEQVSSQLPEALVIPCAETPEGAIAQLPANLDLAQFDAIAAGPGLSLDSQILPPVLAANPPLLLDADGLNGLARLFPTIALPAITVLTPHPGEFKRLFPSFADRSGTQAEKAKWAADHSGAIVVLKGARTAIAAPQGSVWINPDSTPALARGGSGDVLTGLMAGLMAIAHRANSPQDPHALRDPHALQDPDFPQAAHAILAAVKTAVGWHAQAGFQAAQTRTALGVDAWTLSQSLSTVFFKGTSIN